LKTLCFDGVHSLWLCCGAVTYDQLVAFLAVASEGSFVAASARLHKSQPAVSKLIQNLEQELSLELFDRRHYRATLTEAGRLFHERAAAVVESTDALKSFGLELAGLPEAIVRIAVEAVTPLGPLLELLRATRDHHPSVRIELRTERLAGVADAIAAGNADLGVGTLLGGERAQLEATPWTRVRVVPVARADHPLATCGTPIPPALVRAHAQIVLRDSGLAAEAPSLNVVAGGLRWSVTDVAAKRDVIAAGMGWGGLPEHVIAGDLARGELVALAVPEFAVEVMELFALRRRDGALGVVAQSLWRALSTPNAHATVTASSRSSGAGAAARRGRDPSRRRSS
jgi:DNA-binding transcriptional LysR family regulator